jgi:hypothetical protein
MEQVRPAAAQDEAVAAAAVGEEAQDEAVAAAGWEGTVRVPDPLEIASARTVEIRHPIRPVSPAITRTALNAGPG